MERRAFLALAAFGAAVTLPGCAGVSNPMAFTNDPLVGNLTRNVSGLSQTQVAGGVGSLLGLAQNRLTAGEFSSVAKTMPNPSDYMRAASGAGVATGDIRDIGGLNDAFAKLGMNPQQARSLLGGVVDWVGKTGGEGPRGMMLRALGM
jgi:hypothetical protein